jgi:hypothetical protein
MPNRLLLTLNPHVNRTMQLFGESVAAGFTNDGHLAIRRFILRRTHDQIQASSCIALFWSDDGERAAWMWNLAKLKTEPLEFTADGDKLEYAPAFVLQVNREMHQPPAP